MVATDPLSIVIPSNAEYEPVLQSTREMSSAARSQLFSETEQLTSNTNQRSAQTQELLDEVSGTVEDIKARFPRAKENGTEDFKKRFKRIKSRTKGNISRLATEYTRELEGMQADVEKKLSTLSEPVAIIKREYQTKLNNTIRKYRRECDNIEQGRREELDKLDDQLVLLQRRLEELPDIIQANKKRKKKKKRKEKTTTARITGRTVAGAVGGCAVAGAAAGVAVGYGMAGYTGWTLLGAAALGGGVGVGVGLIGLGVYWYFFS